MAVLTFKSNEYNTFPPVVMDYARYVSVIKGNSEKTVCEYLLDIRTFLRFMKTKDQQTKPTAAEFEKISISDVTIEDIKAVRVYDVIDYLMFVNYERENSPTTRMR